MKAKALILTGILLLATAPAFAAVDAFLKLDTIQGESQSHPGWIDIESFSWGASTAPATTNLPAVQCSSHSLNFTKKFDRASPMLSQAALNGSPIPSAIFEANGQRHMLQNVQIRSVQKQQMGDGSVREALSLNFTKCGTHETAGTPGALVPAVKIDRSLKLDVNGTIAMSGGGGGAGMPQPIALQDFHFVGQNQAMLACRKAGGDGSAAILIGLLRASQSKQKVPSLTIEARGHDNQAYMKITLTDILVSSYQTGGNGFDQITLNFSHADGAMANFHDAYIK